jgi:hypothetical protein
MGYSTVYLKGRIDEDRRFRETGSDDSASIADYFYVGEAKGEDFYSCRVADADMGTVHPVELPESLIRENVRRESGDGSISILGIFKADERTGDVVIDDDLPPTHWNGDAGN